VARVDVLDDPQGSSYRIADDCCSVLLTEGTKEPEPRDSRDFHNMCDADHGPWCQMFEEHSAAHAHDFCERHQICWCRLCDGRCPDCRTKILLGEPDEWEADDEL
jgi:hypothetical protein